MLKLTTRKIKEDRHRSRLYICGAGTFLTGVNVGFRAGGKLSRQVLAKSAHPLFLVPIATIMGYFIVKAEPAVYVLNKQVERLRTERSPRAMGQDFPWVLRFLSDLRWCGYYRISILWFLIPGYAIALGISFLCRRSIQRSPSTPAAWHRDR